MYETCFLVQIKRTNGTYEKGVVVKDDLNGARQSFHAYLGAYGYGHDPNTDYVQCEIIDSYGIRKDWQLDDRRPVEQVVVELEDE